MNTDPKIVIVTGASQGTPHPRKRMGEIEVKVKAGLYLDGTELVTGEVLRVDGGQHAGRWPADHLTW